MKRITSPESFKTCYIAQVKEEMGFPVRKAHNRKGPDRKIAVRPQLKPFIERAIRRLHRKRKRFPTYRDIQETAFALYNESNGISDTDRFYGIFASDDPEDAISIIEDKHIFYDI